MSRKLDTRAIGLDVALSFARWLTGAENLHYGLWTGLEVSAQNLRAAQEAYTAKLFSYLPDRPCRILDIGGGAGETAKKLLSLGHRVEIVIPSEFLAERCRENAPGAVVHECTFEEFAGKGPFDVCLFSESFQYVPLRESLPKALSLLEPGGEILIGDVFRTDANRAARGEARKAGGGHPVSAFHKALAKLPVDVVAEEDVTEAAAPSIELEQGLFNVLGHGLTRIDAELQATRPAQRWMLTKLLALVMSERRRDGLTRRLTANERTAEAFRTFNRYLIVRLRKRA